MPSGAGAGVNLGRTSLYSLVFQVSGFLCAAGAGIITARTLGPENKGILALVVISVYVLWILFNPCVETAIVHHMGKREYPVAAFAGNALALSLGLGLLGLLFFVATFGLARDIVYKGIEFGHLVVPVLFLPFFFGTYYFSSILRGHMDIAGYNVAMQSLHFSNLLLLLVFLAFWRLSLFEAILAGISGALVGGTYSLVKVLRISEGLQLDRRLLSLLLKDGGVLYAGSLATFVNYQINFFILNYYSSHAEVGFYSVAYAVANVLFFLGISLEAGLFPRIAGASPDEARQLTEVACRQVFVLTGVGAVLLALFARPVVMLYGGSDFLPSAGPLILLLPGTVVAVIPKILAFYWMRKGWLSLLTFVAMGSAVLSISLNLFLIPRFGASGAALATSLTYFAVFLLEIILYRKYMGGALRKLFVPERKDLELYRDVVRVARRTGRSREGNSRI